MKMIKIDGVDHDFDALPENARAQLQGLQFVDIELQRLGMQTAAMKTARLAYAKALTEALQPPRSDTAQQFMGDTLKLS